MPHSLRRRQRRHGSLIPAAVAALGAAVATAGGRGARAPARRGRRLDAAVRGAAVALALVAPAQPRVRQRLRRAESAGGVQLEEASQQAYERGLRRHPALRGTSEHQCGHANLGAVRPPLHTHTHTHTHAHPPHPTRGGGAYARGAPLAARPPRLRPQRPAGTGRRLRARPPRPPRAGSPSGGTTECTPRPTCPPSSCVPRCARTRQQYQLRMHARRVLGARAHLCRSSGAM